MSIIARRARYAIVLVAALWLAACSGLPQRPEIRLVGVELVSLGLGEQRFLLRLNVRNPNAREIVLRALDFSVELDGRHFADGAATDGLRVPAGGEAVLELRAVSSLAALLQQMRVARRDGREKVPYRIFGFAELDGVGRLPFERNGEVASLRAPG